MKFYTRQKTLKKCNALKCIFSLRKLRLEKPKPPHLLHVFTLNLLYIYTCSTRSPQPYSPLKR